MGRGLSSEVICQLRTRVIWEGQVRQRKRLRGMCGERECGEEGRAKVESGQ